MIKAVVFDLDNTLLDFMKMKRTAINAAISRMIFSGLDIEKEVAGISDELAALRKERLEILEGDFDADFKRDMIDMITQDELAAVENVPDLREEALGLSF